MFAVLAIFLSFLHMSNAFAPIWGSSFGRDLALLATRDKFKRAKILNRRGQHFDQDNWKGTIEFGYTANLQTSLENAKSETILKWLEDETLVATSIWDKELMKDLGKKVYRLQLMTLQFVTIQLAPSVDVLMWTERDAAGKPVFKLESVAYDPNVQLIPGVSIDAKSLGIKIEVMGELRLSDDGKGLSGEIGFVSGGSLPPPMRLMPKPAFQAATGLINKTVSDFAVRSFQKGAKENFGKFQRAQEQESTL